MVALDWLEIGKIACPVAIVVVIAAMVVNGRGLSENRTHARRPSGRERTASETRSQGDLNRSARSQKFRERCQIVLGVSLLLLILLLIGEGPPGGGPNGG
jgi:hypothetical protein